MFHLTREVRFAVNPLYDNPLARPPTNSYAGYPSLIGAGHYFELAITVGGELNPASNYLLNIKDVDQHVRRIAIPIVDDLVRHHPRRPGAGTMNGLFDLLKDAWAPVRLERLALA